ncbi:uncharacterized protein [Littorina saxatilis]|uniref:uncharacterized protein isoform X2 n=1 Tax=Littorina saxatilis TaxID=31220 RepID=UPI0038B59806
MMRLGLCYVVVMTTIGATRAGGKLISYEDNGMTPEAPFVFVGETLRLCCNVTRAYRDVTAPSDVMFFAKDEAVREAEIGWQPGSRSVVCMEYAVEHTPFKLKKYYCNVSVPPPSPPQHRLHQQQQQQCLGYQIVRTDYSPKSLMENFQVECVLEEVNLTCVFADVKQRGIVPQRSTLSVHFSRRGTQRALDVTCRQGTCSTTLWQGTDFFLPEIVSFNITLTYTVTDAGTWNDNHTYHFTNITQSGAHVFQITPSQRVRVPPPRQLSVTSLNASCLHVTWRVVSWEQLHWRLVLFSPRNTSILKEEALEGKNLTSYQLCDPDISPFTLYNVTLSCRRGSSQVWSHVTATSVRTPMAPPDGSPDLAPGYSFRGEHEAVFYWKPVSANGPKLDYQVTITTARQHTATPSPRPQRTVHLTTNVTHVSVRVDDLDLDAGSEVHVQAENAAGGGRVVSAIRLAPGLDEGPELLAIVEKEKADFVTLNITWPAALSSFIDSYTVFWCAHSTRVPGDCKGEVAWQSVPANTTWYSLAVRSSAWPVTYGVSTQYSVGDSILTTGFRFSACFFTRDNAGTLQAVYSQGCNGKMLAVSYFREPLYVAAAFVVVGCLAGISCCALVVTGARAASARFRQAEQKFAKHITHRTEMRSLKRKELFQLLDFQCAMRTSAW